ncbi:hypothetical protein ZIOFF_045189 [Zingiber officinale]|uniref:Uncharacterized protein n=1 Tax=Zingiber officinale TaxID=94328 RepID=A0A8J5L0T9_ZINOF|nr:hypothetical protein ZIOFF_045189 [Zingiber officinale]
MSNVTLTYFLFRVILASFAPLFLPVIQLDPPPPRTGSGPSRKIKAVHPELLSFFPNIVTFESYKPVTVEGNRLEEVVMWIWFLQATQCPNKCGQFTNEFV